MCVSLCDNILFIHAVLRCDTRSGLYGLGKGASLKKLGSSQHFQRQAVWEAASTEQVIDAGERERLHAFTMENQKAVWFL